MEREVGDLKNIISGKGFPLEEENDDDEGVQKKKKKKAKKAKEEGGQVETVKKEGKSKDEDQEFLMRYPFLAIF